MKKEMICIECPRGCLLEVTLDGGRVSAVSGNLCPRGSAYAKAECEAPRRVVTGTVRLKDGGLLPVRTNGAVLRDRMMDVMAALASTTVTPPIAMGDVVIPAVDGEIDVIACRTVKGET